MRLLVLFVLVILPIQAQTLNTRWTTYFGGASSHYSTHTVDSQGNVIVAGHTTSTAIPTTANAFQSTNKGARDLFVAKLSPAGQLIWATYYGGTQDDYLDKVATDSSGNIYLSGRTASIDFPRTTFVGSGGYILVLDGNGQRRWALAGGGIAEILDIVPNNNGSVTACGYTTDLGLSPGAFSLQNTYGGGERDGLLAVISGSGVPSFLTYLGGSGRDTISACTVDARGVIHAAFTSNSSGYPGAGIIGIDPVRQTLNYTTPINLGPTGYAYGVALDKESVWLTGSTGSSLNVTANGQVRTAPNGENAFLARVSTSGTLLYNSYLGGNGADYAYAITADPSGNVYVCGATNSSNWPVTTGALNATRVSSVTDAFLNIHKPDGSIAYATYLNGTGSTFCNTLTVSASTLIASGVASNTLALVNNGTISNTPPGPVSTWLLNFNVVNPNTPSFTSSSITNAASFATGGIAPGEIVTIFAQGAGPATLAGLQLTGDRRVSTTTGSTRVLFDGTAAPMVYSVAGQISAIVPYNVSGKSTVQVIIEYNNIQSAAVSVPVVSAAPGLFAIASGSGQVVAILPAGCCNSATAPARRGDIIVLYATGEGQTTPAGRDGSLAEYPTLAEYPKPVQTVSLTIGGRPAEILYAGAAPNYVAGLMQLNVRIPTDAPLGEQVPVLLTIGNRTSPAGVTMVIR